MHPKRLPPLAIAIATHTLSTSAQTLAEMLAAQNATLSVLNGFLEQQQALFNTFSTAQDITVLAPSNAALNSLPADVTNRVSSDPNFLAALLSYHVLNGTYYTSNLTLTTSPNYIRTLLNSTSYSNVTGGQRIVSHSSSDGNVKFSSGGQSSTTVQSPNYNFTGGTIHIVDAMLTMPSNLTNTLLGANLTAAVGAIKQSGMSSNLDTESEVTVFAPSNAAFEAIGNLVSTMTADDLKNVLGYHVVQGKVLYSYLMGNNSAGTTQGAVVIFRAEDRAMFVNSARVLVADVLISNGVMHIIDGVLNPANTAATPDPTASTQAPAFSGASATGAVPFTTGIVPPAAITSGAISATITVKPDSASGSAADARSAAMGLLVAVGGVAALMNL